jgi:hypothetical protein
MSITQLSVFVENKPGHLADTFGTIAEGGVNVLNFTIADTADYGVLRLVVDDVGRAKQVLGAGGYAVVEHQVVGAFLPNVPGTLANITRMVADSGLDIEYFYIGRGDSLLLKTEELEKLETLLREHGFRVLQPGDLD